MVDSKRIQGIVNAMLSKARNLERISEKKLSDKEKGDLMRLQKMLAKELE